MQQPRYKEKRTLPNGMQISEQAYETLCYFKDYADAPNLGISLELCCWITRKVLATPHLADEILRQLPSSPEGIPLNEIKAFKKKMLEGEV